MTVELLRPAALGAADLAAWRAMQLASPELASPFLAPEFAQVLGRVRDDAHVAVLREDDAAVGFLAFHRRRLGVGVPIGAGLSDVQGLVHVPGLRWDPVALLRGCGLAVWEFDHLLAAQAPFAPFHRRPAASPVIDLAGGYDAYLAERRASERIRVALRKARKLERELGEVRFEFDSRDRDGLEAVLRWKSLQYRRTGRRDRFAQPWIARVVDELFEQRAPGCRGTLSLLWAGDSLVAGHFGLASERVLTSWFPAYDPAAARYSPGWSLFLRMAEAAAAGGLLQIDLGKGDEPYKQSLKSGDVALAEGWVRRRSPAAVLRAAQREPRRRVLDLVLGTPALRGAARRSLNGIGRLRGTGRAYRQTNR